MAVGGKGQALDLDPLEKTGRNFQNLQDSVSYQALRELCIDSYQMNQILPHRHALITQTLFKPLLYTRNCELDCPHWMNLEQFP